MYYNIAVMSGGGPCTVLGTASLPPSSPPGQPDDVVIATFFNKTSMERFWLCEETETFWNIRRLQLS